MRFITIHQNTPDADTPGMPEAKPLETVNFLISHQSMSFYVWLCRVGIVHRRTGCPSIIKLVVLRQFPGVTKHNICSFRACIRNPSECQTSGLQKVLLLRIAPGHFYQRKITKKSRHTNLWCKVIGIRRLFMGSSIGEKAEEP